MGQNRRCSPPAVVLLLFLLLGDAKSATLKIGDEELLFGESESYMWPPASNSLRLPAATKTWLGTSLSQVGGMAPSYNQGPMLLDLAYNCPRSGRFAKYGSCRHYYQCEEITELGLLTVYLLTCPPGTVFDDTLETCDLASQVTTRPECLKDGTNPSVVRFDRTKADVVVTIERNDLALPSVDETDSTDIVNRTPFLKRRKRFVFTGTGLIASLASAGTIAGGLGAIASAVIAGSDGVTGTDLKGIENILTGIEGKIKDVNLSVLESQTENRINSEIIQNLVRRGIDASKSDFEITRSLINRGILENRINTAVVQGLISEGNRNNELNFAKVQVSINEVQQFISQEMSKAKSEIRKGFSSISNLIEKSRIEPLVSKLLSSIKEFRQKLNHLKSLPEENKRDEIERDRGFLEYLESSTLQNTLYDIINQNFAVPSHATDVTALFMLDLLVHGLEIHAHMLASAITSNVYLSGKALEERSLTEFNAYMLRVTSSTQRVKSALGYQGLIGEVKEVLNSIQQLSYASHIIGLSDLLSEKRSALVQLESDLERIIIDNTEMDEPGQIKGKLDFNTSSVSVPIGNWLNGKQVSYAIQFASKTGLSRIGEWSKAYTVQNKANPTIQLPAVGTGVTRLIYRKFNQEKPELVAVLQNNQQIFIRDIGREMINAASRPNENLAVKETRALISKEADVNVVLENKMTPLHYASKYGNLKVMDLLIRNGADVHATSNDNEEALHFAALFGSGKAIEYLVNEGADVNAQTRLLGLSSLHVAVANNHVDATRALIRKGAFINIKDNSGLTPLHISIAGDGGTTEVLLENESVDVNAVAEDGLTPLHYAARSLKDVFVRKLLQHKDTDISPLNDSLLSPLHIAAMNGNPNIMTILIEHGAPVSASDKHGSTPLHYAAFYGNREAALLLIQFDRSLIDIKNNEGKTALDLAVENDRQTVVEVLKTSTDILKEIIADSIRDQPVEPGHTSTDMTTSIPETKSTCSQQVDNMARSTEDTCIYIGHVESYVNLVMGMIPLRKYYDNQEEFTLIFTNYDNDLEAAQRHTNIWRSGDSIIKGIRQTFELAKEFEPEFNRKYQINKRRVETIKENEKEVKSINQIKTDITNLEEQLLNTTEQMKLLPAHMSSLQDFFKNTISNLENQLDEKRRILKEDFTLTAELEELIAFLEFVRADSSEIKIVAEKTKEKIVIFRDDLVGDKGAFERHTRIAKEAFEKIENETIENNIELAELKTKQENLEREIKEARQQVKILDENILATHKELREMRRKLIDKISSTSTWKMVGALLTPFVIGIPLLITASNAEKSHIQTLQSTTDVVNSQLLQFRNLISNKYEDIELLQQTLIGNSNTSYQIKTEMQDFTTLNSDLRNMADQLDKLLPAIRKAIDGVKAIQDVFDVVTEKLGKMIDKAKKAKTEAEKINVKYFLYNELSSLECNWKDAYLKILNLDECTKNFQMFV